jgi:hypothetical protein
MAARASSFLRSVLYNNSSSICYSSMSNQLDNLRAAYRVLEDRVIRSLRTQMGDAVRLGEQRSQALQFLQAAEQAS